MLTRLWTSGKINKDGWARKDFFLLVGGKVGGKGGGRGIGGNEVLVTTSFSVQCK